MIFLGGVMALTIGVIYAVGVFYGWRIFLTRFGARQLVGYWEIAGTDWKSHASHQRKIVLKRGAFMAIGSPIVVIGVMLVLAFFDDDVAGTLPIALLTGFVAGAIFVAIAGVQWFSLGAKNGRVWLARRGIMVNGNVFFCDSFGVMLLGYELNGGNLSLRYEVRTRRTVGEHEMVVPVPSTHTDLVRDTVAAWSPRA